MGSGAPTRGADAPLPAEAPSRGRGARLEGGSLAWSTRSTGGHRPISPPPGGGGGGCIILRRRGCRSRVGEEADGEADVRRRGGFHGDSTHSTVGFYIGGLCPCRRRKGGPGEEAMARPRGVARSTREAQTMARRTCRSLAVSSPSPPPTRRGQSGTCPHRPPAAAAARSLVQGGSIEGGEPKWSH